MYYNNINPNINPNFNSNDRVFFPFFPFLLGGLAGGALVSASRPRPVFVNPPLYAPYPPRPYTPYPPYRPYGNPGGYYNYSSGGYY